jgi:hypothetical protein
MAEWNEAEAQKTLAEITKRSQTDPEYRKLVLKDPNTAIAKVNSTPMPAGFKVQFVDNEGANLTIVLPDALSNNAELSDAELEQVAGGGRCSASCAASCEFTSVF